MKSHTWKVKHYYQPTNNTCGYTALATMLSHYDSEYTPEEIADKVPQPKNDDGTLQGSVTSQLVDWCQTQGFQVHMYTSDLWVLDLSWKDKNTDEIKELLEKIKSTRDIPAIGAHWTKVYIESYISMINNGAKLTVTPLIKTNLLYELLQEGPIYANICSTANDGKGRTRNIGLRESVIDYIEGRVSTHSVVIYGNDEDGNFLVADPWDGMTIIEPEQLVLSIEAAQIECDNQIFIIKK